VSGTIERLDRLDEPRRSPREGAGPDHPMRVVTRQVAFEAAWDGERSTKVASLFDGLAAEWQGRDEPGRLAPLDDALTRGRVATGGRWLEVGSGIGLVTPTLLAAAGAASFISVDLSWEMLVRAPRLAPRLRADQAALPLPGASVDVAVHVNALLFPAEIARVLGPAGTLVWVCTRGDETPIYLDADDVVAALPGQWTGVASAAGAGTWAVLRRA
jgi:SAM-dependent methyltransferase